MRRNPGKPRNHPAPADPGGTPDSGVEWTFLTNHAHVLLCIARNPEVTMREVAEEVGITERAVQRIVADLEHAGYLRRARSGRRNRYELRPDMPLRHRVERHRSVASLIALVLDRQPPDRPKRRRRAEQT